VWDYGSGRKVCDVSDLQHDTKVRPPPPPPHRHTSTHSPPLPFHHAAAEYVIGCFTRSTHAIGWGRVTCWSEGVRPTHWPLSIATASRYTCGILKYQFYCLLIHLSPVFTTLLSAPLSPLVLFSFSPTPEGGQAQGSGLSGLLVLCVCGRETVGSNRWSVRIVRLPSGSPQVEGFPRTTWQCFLVIIN